MGALSCPATLGGGCCSAGDTCGLSICVMLRRTSGVVTSTLLTTNSYSAGTVATSAISAFSTATITFGNPGASAVVLQASPTYLSIFTVSSSSTVEKLTETVFTASSGGAATAETVSPSGGGNSLTTAEVAGISVGAVSLALVIAVAAFFATRHFILRSTSRLMGRRGPLVNGAVEGKPELMATDRAVMPRSEIQGEELGELAAQEQAWELENLGRHGTYPGHELMGSNDI